MDVNGVRPYQEEADETEKLPTETIDVEAMGVGFETCSNDF